LPRSGPAAYLGIALGPACANLPPSCPFTWMGQGHLAAIRSGGIPGYSLGTCLRQSAPLLPVYLDGAGAPCRDQVRRHTWVQPWDLLAPICPPPARLPGRGGQEHLAAIRSGGILGYSLGTCLRQSALCRPFGLAVGAGLAPGFFLSIWVVPAKLSAFLGLPFAVSAQGQAGRFFLCRGWAGG
jgi:hypothetical protein